MIAIDDSLFDDVNLAALPTEAKRDLAAAIRDELELRVGTVIVEGLSEADLDEFEALAHNGDQEGALQWLCERVPNYREVVEAEFKALKGELKDDAPKILSFAGGDAEQH
jgi:hypothetical protein